MKRLALVLGAIAAGCGSAPPKEVLPERAPVPESRTVRPDEIVAIFNGEPLSWQTVAEKMLELNRKEAVDHYVRWRIVADRRKALDIVHTPEELRRRAAVYLEQAKRSMGEERFRQQLAREGSTEDAKRAQLEGSQFLAEVFTLDKIVRYSEVLEDRIEIDRVCFATEAEARTFHAACESRGFDDAVKELEQGPRKKEVGRLPRERFPKSAPPTEPLLDAWIVDGLSGMAPGTFTGVETSRSNLYYVIRLEAVRKARNVVYSEVRQEVLEAVLKDPPTQAEYLRWMEREMARSRIDYADVKSGRETLRGKP